MFWELNSVHLGKQENAYLEKGKTSMTNKVLLLALVHFVHINIHKNQKIMIIILGIKMLISIIVKNVIYSFLWRRFHAFDDLEFRNWQLKLWRSSRETLVALCLTGPQDCRHCCSQYPFLLNHQLISIVLVLNSTSKMNSESNTRAINQKSSIHMIRQIKRLTNLCVWRMYANAFEK